MTKAILGKNQVKQKLANGTAVNGTFVVTAEAALTEMLGYAGFDFIIIDSEHAPNHTMEIQQHIRAAEISGLTPIVRVTTNEPSLILRALDLGAGGVLVPQVNTAAEAEAAVCAAKYGPEGTRGMAGVVRAARYGFVGSAEYIRHAKEETLVITQVEHIEAVRNLDAILAVEGLDGVFIGPTDLSQSMGLAGQFQNPELRAVMEDVISRTLNSGKWVGSFCLDAEDARYWRSKGVKFLAIGTEGMLFAAAVKSVIGQVNA